MLLDLLKEKLEEARIRGSASVTISRYHLETLIKLVEQVNQVDPPNEQQ